MLFTSAAVIAAALVASSANAAPVTRLELQGHHEDTYIKHTYMIQFPTDACTKATPEELLKKGIQSSVNYTVRTTTSTKLACMVSFEVKNQEDSLAFASAVLGAEGLFAVSTRARPKVVRTGSPAAGFDPEAIHGLTGVNEVRSAYGYLGKGMNVAVIDSGIYYYHPALGGGFGSGFKVAGGYDLVGDAYTGSNAPVPDEDPLDICSTESHGTHVAGIIAADARNIPAITSANATFQPFAPFTGVAPEANLFAYRVFGCEGSSGNDVITSAIYRAAENGADVINLSLGGGPVYNDESDAVAALIVGQQGSVVCAANGNDGGSGIYTAGSPGVSVGGFGVAAFDNALQLLPKLTVDSVAFPYSIGGTNGNFAFGQEYDVIVNNPDADANNVMDDCFNGCAVNATGKALLIRWGNKLRSAVRCNHALAAGAVACILYAYDDNIPNIAGGNLPSLATSHEAGLALLAAIQAGQKPKFIVTQSQGLFPIKTAGTVSDFSSPGLDLDLFIKPDIGGIGGSVYSTISTFAASKIGDGNGPAYAVYSGTSMATPNFVGAVALYMQAKGRQSFNDVHVAFQNGAVPAHKYGTNLTDSVAYQGAGLHNAYNTISSQTIITPSSLALNDTTHTAQHYTIVISNQDTVAKTYTIGHQPALMVTPFAEGDDSIQLPDTTLYTPDYGTVSFTYSNSAKRSSLQVTVNPGSSASINVDFVPPANANPALYPVYSGYITVTPDGATYSRVPYAGVVGDWKAAPVWVRKSAAFDQIYMQAVFGPRGINTITPDSSFGTGVFDGSLSFLPLAEGSVFNLTNGENPFLVLAAATTSRLAKVEVIFAGADSSILPKELRHTATLGDVIVEVVDFSALSSPTFGQPQGFSLFSGSPIQRNGPTVGQSIATPQFGAFIGSTLLNNVQYNLPAGTYRVRFSALKHFGRVGSNAAGTNYDTILSPAFGIVY